MWQPQAVSVQNYADSTFLMTQHGILVSFPSLTQVPTAPLLANGISSFPEQLQDPEIPA